MKAMPDGADLAALKWAAFAVLDTECANAIKVGAKATVATEVAASLATFLRECSPKFPPISQRLTAKSTALRDAAREQGDALTLTTNHAIVLTFALILSGLALVVVGAFFALRSWVTSPLSALEGVMKRLSGGELDAGVSGLDRRDELGSMAKAVQVFKGAGLEKVRLENVAAETRKAAERERDRNHAEAERLRAMADAVVADVGKAVTALAGGDLTYRFRADVPAEVATSRA